VWAFDIEADSFHCLGNATPGGGTAVLVAEGCLFADAARQTAESSRLLFVSEAGCRVAGVGAFLREFALAADGSTILLRTFGRRPGIAELPIDGLTTAR